jgi:adenylylsulfate kinase
MSAAHGRVIWITGLSGAGKTTLARGLIPLLPAPVLWLDGDSVRKALASVASGYSREERLRLAYASANLCKLAAEQDLTVVCSIMALFHEIQLWNRNNLPGYFEIFLDMPEEIRLARDYKKVYQERPGSSESTPVVGREIAPEVPLAPDLRLADHNLGPDQQARLALKALAKAWRTEPAGD